MKLPGLENYSKRKDTSTGQLTAGDDKCEKAIRKNKNGQK